MPGAPAGNPEDNVESSSLARLVQVSSRALAVDDHWGAECEGERHRTSDRTLSASAPDKASGSL